MSENDLTIKILQGIREGAAPGGWWFATEVDIRLADDGFRPDIAGWRRERMPGLITDRPVTLRPDWICEATSSDRYLDAVWAAEPGASSHQTLALRTATQIELFRVPTDLAASCSSQPAGCPVRVGAVALTDGAGPLAPTDWAVVQDASEVRIYVLNGSNSVFIGTPATPAGFQTLVVGAQSWHDVETAPVSSKVYVLDGEAPTLAIIDDATVLQIDTSRAGVSSFLMGRPLRVAPSATYAYAPGQMGRLIAGHIEAWAVFLGGLVP